MADKYEKKAFIVFTASMIYIPVMIVLFFAATIITSLTADASFQENLLSTPVGVGIYVAFTNLWILGLLIAAIFDKKASKYR